MNLVKKWLIVLFIGVCTGAYAQEPQLDVPYVPTNQETVEKMLELADVKPGDVVYDLGCGDGRIVITAAKKFGATGVGVDLNPQRIEEANENAEAAGVTDKVTFIQGDLFEFDFSKANVLTLYLLPSVNLELMPKVKRELKPGSRVVSHDFDMGDWKPEKTVKVGSDIIYLWTIQ
jgi:cyclopropane fatty-acyl-phospholipid synthase-like methyltransferase